MHFLYRPKLNGFETCEPDRTSGTAFFLITYASFCLLARIAIQMRRIEKEQGRQPSQIVAVTALSSEEHRSRGLNESVLPGTDPPPSPLCLSR